MSHGMQGAVTQDAEEGSGGGHIRNQGKILHTSREGTLRQGRNAWQENEKRWSFCWRGLDQLMQRTAP